MNPDTQPFYFLHIPKTAGTTLTDYLERHFEQKDIMPHGVWGELLQDDAFDTTKGKLFDGAEFYLYRGHFGYSLIQELDRPARIITVLRNPVERTVSQFFHIQFRPNDNKWVEPGFVDPDETIAQFVKDNKRRAVISNVQTRYLALSVDFKNYYNKRGETESLYLADSEQAFISPELPDKELLARALTRLDESEFVGLQDFFQESLILLAHTLKWHPQEDKTRLQVVTQRPSSRELGFATKQRLRAMNTLDQKVYDHGKALFMKRYVALIKERLGTELSESEFLSQRRKMNAALLADYETNGFND